MRCDLVSQPRIRSPLFGKAQLSAYYAVTAVSYLQGRDVHAAVSSIDALLGPHQHILCPHRTLSRGGQYHKGRFEVYKCVYKFLLRPVEDAAAIRNSASARPPDGSTTARLLSGGGSAFLRSSGSSCSRQQPMLTSLSSSGIRQEIMT